MVKNMCVCIYFDVNEIIEIIKSASPITYAIFGVLILFFVILVISTLFFRPSKKSFKKFERVKTEKNIRRFTLNYEKKQVRYFDRWNIRGYKIITIDEFVMKFAENDRNSIKIWLTELTKKGSTVPHLLECQVYLKNIKMNVNSILEATSINYRKKLIHLESHLLFELSKTKFRGHHKKKLVNLEEVQNRVANLSSAEPINVFLIRLIDTSMMLKNENFEIDSLFTSQLINRLFKYVNQNRFVVRLKSDEILVVDFKAKRRNDVYNLGYSIESEIIRFIKINSLGKELDFQIGIACQKGSFSNLEDMIKIARETSKYSEKSDYNGHVMIFDETIDLAKNYHAVMIEEAKRLIKDNEFNYYISPVFESKSGRMVGMFEEYSSVNSKLKSMREIFEFAYIANKASELYLLLVKESFDRYQNIGGKSALSTKRPFMVIDLPLTYFDQFKRLDKLILNAKKQLIPVLAINDYDLENWLKDGKKFDSLANYVEKNEIELAIRLSRLGIESFDKYLPSFDYVIVDEMLVKDIAHDTQVKAFFNDLIDKLKKNKIEMIVNNVSSIALIEALIKLRIDYVSSPLLCAKGTDIESPNKKRLAKLKSN